MFDPAFAIKLNIAGLLMYRRYMSECGFSERQINLLNKFLYKKEMFAKYARVEYSARTLEQINFIENWSIDGGAVTREEKDAQIALAILENEN